VRRLLWFGAWTAVALWSLFALVTYNLLDFAGSVAMRNADAFSTDPETVEWIFNVFRWMRGLSTSIALVVWGVISLAILAVPWLLDRIIGRSVVVRPGVPVSTAPRDGVIDLGPDQYSVRTGGPIGPAHGSVPQVPPRR
jgi:hypothetical protein